MRGRKMDWAMGREMVGQTFFAKTLLANVGDPIIICHSL